MNIYRVISNLKRRYYDFLFYSLKPVVDTNDGRSLDGFEGVCRNYISDISKRKNELPSISFIYRLKDAEKYIELSVLSVLPVANEIVFVDNGSSDGTLAVIEKLVRDYNHMCNFKVCTYDQEVHRQGLDYQDRLTQDPRGSLADYYNYCFSLAESDYVFKMDAHKYLLPVVFQHIQDRIYNGSPIVFIRGHDFFGRRISYEPLLYRNTPDINYLDGEYYEYLDYSSLNLSKNELYRSRIDIKGFIHLKSLSYSSFLASK